MDEDQLSAEPNDEAEDETSTEVEPEEERRGIPIMSIIMGIFRAPG